MAELNVILATTLDGFIAGEDGSLDWIIMGDERADYMAEWSKRADTLLLGRRSYQGFITFWPGAPNNPNATPAEKTIGQHYNAMRKVLFSTTLTRADWLETTVMHSIEPDRVRELKAESKKGVRVDGSISVVQQLTKLGLIDEYRLMVHPVALGRGRPLFTERVDLDLVESERWRNGVVVHTYRLASGAAVESVGFTRPEVQGDPPHDGE
ncbi:MAG: dihydrofolate reductase [Trueperaceae bacterium]|nr:dihydrofolate reductase [Trueperaceae bacterium]MCW5819132.1 dihydrofolate reductase [Trueperaceae bacterium]